MMMRVARPLPMGEDFPMAPMASLQDDRAPWKSELTWRILLRRPISVRSYRSAVAGSFKLSQCICEVASQMAKVFAECDGFLTCRKLPGQTMVNTAGNLVGQAICVVVFCRLGERDWSNLKALWILETSENSLANSGATPRASGSSFWTSPFGVYLFCGAAPRSNMSTVTASQGDRKEGRE